MKFKIDGKSVECDRAAYVKAKTKQLREFGYPSLTEREVNEQIDCLIAGKTLGNGLTVIGKFMEEEVIITKTGK